MTLVHCKQLLGLQRLSSIGRQAIQRIAKESGSVPTYTTPLDCSRLLRVAGTLASAVGGTVKLDEPGGATQTNSPVTFDGRSTPPPKTITVWPAGAPLQFTVKPWLRVMEDVWARLLQVSGVGKVKLAAMAPTSAPPAPASEKLPGLRNSDVGTRDPS